MIDLSIVIPTCNRAALLRQALDSILATAHCAYEVVVVDGASTDETARVLESMESKLDGRLRVVREPKREGFVRGINKGFRAARGEYMVWLNDDARPLTGALDGTLKQLRESPPDVGLAAMFHRCGAKRSVAREVEHDGAMYRLMHVRGTLYANFGMARRELFHLLGYFDERYYLNAADPDFSLKVWMSGLKVVPAEGAFIDHDEHADERRAGDEPRGQEDNARLFEKWDLPVKNPLCNDFDPARPCTVRGLRSMLNMPPAGPFTPVAA